ncbi:hypothetical protein J2847_004722 [Azospirillum agricola]|nr:hypothetical protein [Azospirillum agricola]
MDRRLRARDTPAPAEKPRPSQDPLTVQNMRKPF